MAQYSIRTAVLTSVLALTSACGDDGVDNRYQQALPSADVLTVNVPAESSAALTMSREGEIGTTRSALVGQPADFYVSTYYQARRINRFGRGVLEILEAITSTPPTATGANAAVWGPFRDDREPNEFRLGVEERTQPELHYAWQLEGRPVSGGDFTALAGGAFQPTAPEQGQGWFAVDFDAIRMLDPTEEAEGQVAYAFAKTDEGVAVRMMASEPSPAGGETPIAYAFGENAEGFGYVLFAFADNIDDDPNRTAEEDLVVRTRWRPDGKGRADVLAVRGDVGAGFVQVSQCWDNIFVSRYEVFTVNGATVVEQGDSTVCVFDGAWPVAGDVPVAEDLINPFEG